MEGGFTTITNNLGINTDKLGLCSGKKGKKSYPDHTDCSSDKMTLDASGTWESLQAGKVFTKLVRERTVSAAEMSC